jgi:hypothetical protein
MQRRSSESVVQLYPFLFAIFPNVRRWMPVAAATSSTDTRLPNLNDRSAIRSFSLNRITLYAPKASIVAFAHLLM